MEGLQSILDRLPLWSLLFVRIGACLFAMPLFGGRNVPVVAKVGIIMGLTWALLPIIPVAQTTLPRELWAWALALIREAIVGLSLGWMVQLCLAAVPLAGQMVGFQMGFGIANVMDPMGQQQMSVISQFFYLIAIWVFLSVDGHHLVILALVRTLREVPLGAGGMISDGFGAAVEGGRHLLSSAFMLAAPMLLILMFIQVAMGIVARTVPQMNVFFVGLPLQIGVGFLAMGVTLSFFIPWLYRSMSWLNGFFAAAIR
jgi:flagellar biosynthetic protein FliR